MLNNRLSDKNAYLTLYVSDSSISATLLYSHQEIKRDYVIDSKVLIDQDRDDLTSVYFWDQYFEGLENSLDWDFLTGLGEGSSFRQVIPFEDEGRGVTKIRLKIWNHLKEIKDVLTSLRAVSPQIDIEIVDQIKNVSHIPELGDKLGYEDILYLELDPYKFRFYRISHRSEKAKASEGKGEVWETKTAKVAWDSKYSLIDSARSSKFKAFVGIDQNYEKLVNIWANYLLHPTISAPNEFLSDMLRAYLTVQLFSAFNDKQELFKGFGQNGKNSLIIVSGQLGQILTERTLLISILDGLQMRGWFDLFIDQNGHALMFGEQFARGINADTYLVSDEQLGFDATRVYVPEVPGRGDEARLVFDGEVIVSNQTRRPISTITPQLASFELDPGYKNIFGGRFVKGAYVEGLPESFELIAGEGGVPVSKVYIDARFKPVVYGPTAKENSQKLKSWLVNR